MVRSVNRTQIARVGNVRMREPRCTGRGAGKSLGRHPGYPFRWNRVQGRGLVGGAGGIAALASCSADKTGRGVDGVIMVPSTPLHGRQWRQFRARGSSPTRRVGVVTVASGQEVPGRLQGRSGGHQRHHCDHDHGGP
jgi:hypothetical protein